MAWGQPKDLPHCERLFTAVGLWLPGIVVFFGLIGTIGSLFGLIKIRRYMGPTPSLLMITLSCLDFFVLLFHAIRIYFIDNNWPRFAGHPGSSRVPGLVVKRLTYTAYFCESWLVVLIAFNRFISICRPLYYGKANAPRTMRIAIGLLVVVSILIHIPEYVTVDGRYGKSSWTYHPINSTNSGSGKWGGSSDNKWGSDSSDTRITAPNTTTGQDNGYKHSGADFTTTKKPSWSGKTSDSDLDRDGYIRKKRKWWNEEENQWFKTYLMVVDRFLTVFVPCVVLVILESFMVCTLIASRRQRKEMMQTQENSKSSSNDRTAIIILLSVAVSYVIINVPNQIYSIWYWKATDKMDECFIYRLVQNGTMILNSSVNFILYYAMSSIFRRTLIKKLKQQFCRRCYKDIQDGSSTGMVRQNSREMVAKKYKFNTDSSVSTRTTGSTL